MKPPAFQFYAADFIVGTSTMTNEEVGIYIRMLCHQWDRGFVPLDKAARLVGATIPPEVLTKFTEANGELRNERLESERKKQAEFREQQSQRGKAGAAAKWGVARDGTRHASANGQTMAPPFSGHCPNDGSSSSSSSPSSVFSLQTSSSENEGHDAAVAAGHDDGEEVHQEAAQEVEPQLREWLQWWNRLKAELLVPAGVSETAPSQGVLKAWKKAKRDKALVELLRDRDAIEREIRVSDFCRESWFRLEKLFAGTNKDGEFILKKLIDGGYRDTKGSPNGKHGSRTRGPVIGAGQTYDPSAEVTGL